MYMPRGRGGGTPLYKPYTRRYGSSQRVGFLHRFGLKTGIDFAHFGLGSGIVYAGTLVPLCINVYNVSIPNGYEESVICECEMDFKKSFCCGFNLTNERSERVTN